MDENNNNRNDNKQDDLDRKSPHTKLAEVNLILLAGLVVVILVANLVNTVRLPNSTIEQDTEAESIVEQVEDPVIIHPEQGEDDEGIAVPEKITSEKARAKTKVELNTEVLNNNYELILPAMSKDSIANKGFGEVVYNQLGFKVSLKELNWATDPDNGIEGNKVPSLNFYFTNDGDRQANLKVDNVYINGYSFKSFQDKEDNKSILQSKTNKRVQVYLLSEEFKAAGIQEVTEVQFDMHILDKDGNSMVDILNTRLNLYNKYEVEVQQEIDKLNQPNSESTTSNN